MKYFSFVYSFLLSLFLLSCFSVEAANTKKKIFHSQEEANQYLTEHYNRACEYYGRRRWYAAADEFERVIYFFPKSVEAINAYYYLGVCFFEAGEYEFANTAFSNYLKSSEEPEFFEDTLRYKFCIAEHFKCGRKRRLFRIRYCPKWMTAHSMALTVYDEVIAAVPNHDLAAFSLYSKGCLLQYMRHHRESIEAFQTLIRRFPKHELAPNAYLKIAQAYCYQSCYEFQNPDILALAEINARRFREEFPREELVETAEGYVTRIKENYAQGLCDIGLFYERKCLPCSAIIYYQSAIEEFPDTQVAAFCRERLRCLNSEVEVQETTEEETDLPSESSSCS